MKLLKKLPGRVPLFSWLMLVAAGILGAAEKQPQAVQVKEGPRAFIEKRKPTFQGR